MLLLQQVHVSQQRRQGIAEFVRDARGEASKGGQIALDAKLAFV